MNNVISQPTSTSAPSIRSADLSLLAVATIWGVNMAVMKLALQEMDLFVFNALRLTLSAIVLGMFAWWERRRGRKSSIHTVRDWVLVVVFALLVGGLYQMVFAIGISRTTAGNTALIMSSMPMWTALLAFAILRERLGAAWLGLTLAFLGTVVVTLEKGISFDSDNLQGNLIVLVAALAWAGAAVVSRPMLKRISPILLAFLATAGTLPLHYAAVPVFSTGPMASQPWWVVCCVIYSGVFSTGIAYALWNFGVQQLGPSHAAVYQNLVPVIALIAALIMLGEQVGAMQLTGGALILFGLYLTRKLRPNPAQSREST